jgi:uncharacterized damage-inducible protein DinB
VNAIRDRTDEELAIPAGASAWPIWAIVGHDAGARVYWLCRVVGEPGVDRTPFAALSEDDGWEDHLDQPRSAGELVWALESTFGIIDQVLDAWTPAMLDEEVERVYGEARQIHTRASILQRLLTHDAWHAAQISDALVLHGVADIDLWRPD